MNTYGLGYINRMKGRQMPGGRVIDYADLKDSNRKIWVEVDGPLKRLTVVLGKCELDIGDIVYWELMDAWVVPQSKIDEIENATERPDEWIAENEHLESLSAEEQEDHEDGFRLSVPRFYIQGMTFEEASVEVPKYEKVISGLASTDVTENELVAPSFVTECVDHDKSCPKCQRGIMAATAMALKGATVHAVMHHDEGVFVLCEDKGYDAIDKLREDVMTDSELDIPDYVKVLEPLTGDDNDPDEGEYDFDL